MFSRSFNNALVFLAVCVLYHTMHGDGKPLSRRSVSEVQLMHTVGIHKHEQERQDWLHEKMLELHTAPLSASSDQDASSEHEDITTTPRARADSELDLEHCCSS